jgi:hypothetical protein
LIQGVAMQTMVSQPFQFQDKQRAAHLPRPLQLSLHSAKLSAAANATHAA